MNVETKYAGFWLRALALMIDAVLVGLIVFPFAFCVALANPSLIVVEVPFGLFTTTERLSEPSGEAMARTDGSRRVVRSWTERDDVLGLWRYTFKVTEERSGNDSVTNRSLIDPDTQRELNVTTSGNVEFVLIFLYWILLEASRRQASIGKQALGLRVQTSDGGRPSLPVCIGRNLLKILSGLILFIGFVMAGCTRRSQALHDKLTGTVVIRVTKAAQVQVNPMANVKVADDFVAGR